MKMNKSVIYSVVLSLLLYGCAAATPEAPPTTTPLPEPDILDEIVITHENLFPLGIGFDKNRKQFLVSSLTEGIIYLVNDDGSLELFIVDDELQMTAGLEIDNKNNRILVTSTSQAEDQSMLAAYDLSTSERIFLVNLSDLSSSLSHNSYDVAVDSNGIAYVTDFYSPVIYRVDKDGEASVFIEDRLINFGNGIVVHTDGFLIFGSSGFLYKVPIENPEIIQIDIPEGYLGIGPSASLVLHPDGSLIATDAMSNKIGRLSSTDNWSSASHVGMSLAHSKYDPVTVLKDEDIYVIHSYWARWDEGKDQDTFEIMKVEFR